MYEWNKRPLKADVIVNFIEVFATSLVSATTIAFIDLALNSPKNMWNIDIIIIIIWWPAGLVVWGPDYKTRGPGFESR
jgi:hypothetical protein